MPSKRCSVVANQESVETAVAEVLFVALWHFPSLSFSSSSDNWCYFLSFSFDIRLFVCLFTAFASRSFFNTFHFVMCSFPLSSASIWTKKRMVVVCGYDINPVWSRTDL